jgi:hypothetical protein
MREQDRQGPGRSVKFHTVFEVVAHMGIGYAARECGIAEGLQKDFMIR